MITLSDNAINAIIQEADAASERQIKERIKIWRDSSSVSKNIDSLIRTAILVEGHEATELGLEPSQYEEVLHRDLLFAAQQMANDIRVGAELRSHILSRLLEEYIDSPGINNQLRKRIQTIVEKSQETLNITPITQNIIDKLQSSDVTMLTPTIEALGQLEQSTPEILAALVQIVNGNYEDKNIRSNATWALGKLSTNDSHVVNILINALTTDQNTLVRISAASALGNQSPSNPHVVGILTNIRETDENQVVRMSAGLALRRLTKKPLETIDDFIYTLKHDTDEDTCKAAIYALGRQQQPTPEVTKALIQALGDQKLIRKEAREALMSLAQNHPFVIDALVEALKTNENSTIRSLSASALGYVRQFTNSVMDALISALSHDTASSVRSLSADVLGYATQRTAEVADHLVHTLNNDEDNDVRRSAARGLNSLNYVRPDVIDGLIRTLQSNPYVYAREDALEALGKLAQSAPEIVPIIIDTLQHSPEKDIRSKAIDALEELFPPSPNAIEALMRVVLEDEDRRLSCYAALALGKLGQVTPEVINNVILALHDPNKYVRSTAILASKYLMATSPKLVDVFMEVIQNDPESNIRGRALTRLGECAPPTDKVVNTLLDALINNDDLRASAARALGNFEHPNATIINELINVMVSEEKSDHRVAAQALGRLARNKHEVIDALFERLPQFGSDTIAYFVVGLFGRTFVKKDLIAIVGESKRKLEALLFQALYGIPMNMYHMLNGVHYDTTHTMLWDILWYISHSDDASLIANA